VYFWAPGFLGELKFLWGRTFFRVKCFQHRESYLDHVVAHLLPAVEILCNLESHMARSTGALGEMEEKHPASEGTDPLRYLLVKRALLVLPAEGHDQKIFDACVPELMGAFALLLKIYI